MINREREIGLPAAEIHDSQLFYCFRAVREPVRQLRNDVGDELEKAVDLAEFAVL